MIPKSLSASSILVSEACMERWKVENFWKTPQQSGEPANIGTTCHYALEHFVNDVYIEGKYGWDQIQHLNAYYQLGYVETFGSTNFDTEAYRDGEQLIAAWYDRNRAGLPDKVVSCEVKENFPIKTSAGEIPFNYIWDRCDQIGDTEFHVVDYKSLRGYVRPEELKQKIQPRAYALAAQIKWPFATKIWVSFDMLRFDGITGTVFTTEENRDTYRYLKRAAERIIATDEDDTLEILNPECKWCIKKTNCETLLKANRGGTWHGMTAEDAARKKLEIGSQLQALNYANGELDKILEQEAEARDEIEFTTGGVKVFFSTRSQRKVNSNAIVNIVGQELSAKYGNFTVTNVDKMLKSGELTPEQATQVKAQISKDYSPPKVQVKPVGEFD